MKTLTDVKTALRDKYAWPGGYPLFLITEDGSILSIDAGRRYWRDIVAAHIAPRGDRSWQVAAVEINWDDSELYCDASGARIESAYDNGISAE